MQLTLAINTNAYPEYDKRQLNEMLGLLPLWVAEHVGNDDNTDIVQFMTDRYGFGKLYKFDGKSSPLLNSKGHFEYIIE